MKSIQLNKINFKVERYGDYFIRLVSDKAQALHDIGKCILNARLNFVKEVIATENEICIEIDSNQNEIDLQLLTSLDYNTNLSKKTWKLPVCFDIELDWDIVTKQCNLSKQEYIERILTGEYTLAMLGFLPGFLYINGLATELHVARKSSPSKYIKAGSLAVGGPYIGIYDIDSPGGWNVIGSVPLKMANYRQLPIVPIHQSDKLVFEQISKKQFEEIFALQINLDQYNG